MTVNNFNIKSAKEIDVLSTLDKINYFNEMKQYVLSLPFDQNSNIKKEKKFLNTVKFIGPAFKKIFNPNISYKNPEILNEPFIIVSNHLGSFDQVLLSSAYPEHALHYMIAESLMNVKNLCVGKLYTNRGAFVVDRKSSISRKMVIPTALQYLYTGSNLAMFPEGSRQVKYGSDGTIQEFKNGAVTLSQISGTPIIPIAINNNYKKDQLYINVGEKFNVDPEEKILDKTIILREKMIELWQENKDKGAITLTKKR